MGTTYQRPLLASLLERLGQRRRFLQVLAGPRQAGKTTLARQAMAGLGAPAEYATADAPVPLEPAWLEARWELGRLRANEHGEALLFLDEIQKIRGWSEVVKRLWDQDTHEGVPLKVVVLGSAPLLVQRGLTESLAGRFELIRVPHWSFEEMRDAFGFGIEQFVFFGGYPGAAPLIDDEERWRAYLLDSIIDPTIWRDVLLMTRVDKPALLRRMFRLACEYSGQILSYTKMLGQFHDAGNTTTLAHYLDLLGGAGMVTGLQKYSATAVRRHGSSPKLLALNAALVSPTIGTYFAETRRHPWLWGRLVETCVGAHLLNSAGAGVEIRYWRDRDREVDFVVSRGQKVMAIEVKSGRPRAGRSGLEAFAERYPAARMMLVGGGGLPLEDFLGRPAGYWVR
ncbi:MAG TPA: ATP-binding protein [Actinomycetota bacterium]